jgi:hypothetical protein
MGPNYNFRSYKRTEALTDTSTRRKRLNKADGVQFSHEPSYNYQYLSTSRDADTVSFNSSVYDAWEGRNNEEDLSIWDKLTVLSCSKLIDVSFPQNLVLILIALLGGGGVRALYQLYLLKILFERVAHFEKCLDPENISSADSPMFRFIVDEKDPDAPRSRVKTVKGSYLPCHYFDYIGGTSVGG